jgi:hypothetical protein
MCGGMNPFYVGEEKYINFWKATTLMTEARHVDSPVDKEGGLTTVV